MNVMSNELLTVAEKKTNSLKQLKQLKQNTTRDLH